MKFRDFFFADIITSIGQTLHDIGYTFYFMISRRHIDGHHSNFAEYLKLEVLPIYYIIVGFLPFWFRFWQCINKYHYTKLNAHLWNAGKYFSKLVVPAVTLFSAKQIGGDGFVFYIIFNMIATIYCLIWDYYMDWGLFRAKDSILREKNKMNFEPKFYYFAMVTNFFLRFFWLISIFKYPYESDKDSHMNAFEVMACCAMLAEAIRRTIWSLIRIENEFHNNFEAYRSIPTIPKLKDDD